MKRTHADKDPQRVSDTTKALKPAPSATSAAVKKNVWKITSNLSTQEVENLLNDEENFLQEVDRFEHDVGINQSMIDWHDANFISPFESSFGNSGEFSGRRVSISRLNKCTDCEINSKTLDKQRELLRKLDKQIQDSYRVQKQYRTENDDLKKKVKESMQLVDITTTENVTIKVELQIQKDLVEAMKLKMEIYKEVQPVKRNVISNEEGPLPVGQSKCDKCSYQTTNRVLMEEHKEKTHKGHKVKVCRMCGFIANDKERWVKHNKKHQAELEVGRMKQYPVNVYQFICNPCEISFRTHQDLLEHNTKVHSLNIAQQTKVNKVKDSSTLECTTCSSIFPNIECLVKHQKKHEAENKPDNNLPRDMGNNFKFKCTTCSVAFKSNDDMMNHLSNVHLTEAQRNGAGLSKYLSTNDVSKHDTRPPTCYNGDEC